MWGNPVQSGTPCMRRPYQPAGLAIRQRGLAFPIRGGAPARRGMSFVTVQGGDTGVHRYVWRPGGAKGGAGETTTKVMNGSNRVGSI